MRVSRTGVGLPGDTRDPGVDVSGLDNGGGGLTGGTRGEREECH